MILDFMADFLDFLGKVHQFLFFSMLAHGGMFSVPIATINMASEASEVSKIANH